MVAETHARPRPATALFRDAPLGLCYLLMHRRRQAAVTQQTTDGRAPVGPWAREPIAELGPRILVVDDDEGLRALCRGMLVRRMGYSLVWEACDGEQALEIVEARQPDLVITDLSMPRMNGLELIQRLRRLSHPPAIVVVSGDEGRRREVESLGIEFIPKPLGRSRLERAVHTRIGRPLLPSPRPPPPTRTQPPRSSSHRTVRARFSG